MSNYFFFFTIKLISDDMKKLLWKILSNCLTGKLSLL